jgi:RNA polymerase-binding transcription factor DksA
MSIDVPFSMVDHRKTALIRLVQGSDPVRALRAIEALERMDMGAYGYCTACGMKIPEASLEARPERRHCSACETAAAA